MFPYIFIIFLMMSIAPRNYKFKCFVGEGMTVGEGRTICVGSYMTVGEGRTICVGSYMTVGEGRTICVGN